MRVVIIDLSIGRATTVMNSISGGDPSEATAHISVRGVFCSLRSRHDLSISRYPSTGSWDWVGIEGSFVVLSEESNRVPTSFRHFRACLLYCVGVFARVKSGCYATDQGYALVRDGLLPFPALRSRSACSEYIAVVSF